LGTFAPASEQEIKKHLKEKEHLLKGRKGLRDLDPKKIRGELITLEKSGIISKDRNQEFELTRQGEYAYRRLELMLRGNPLFKKLSRKIAHRVLVAGPKHMLTGINNLRGAVTLIALRSKRNPKSDHLYAQSVQSADKLYMDLSKFTTQFMGTALEDQVRSLLHLMDDVRSYLSLSLDLKRARHNLETIQSVLEHIVEGKQLKLASFYKGQPVTLLPKKTRDSPEGYPAGKAFFIGEVPPGMGLGGYQFQMGRREVFVPYTDAQQVIKKASALDAVVDALEKDGITKYKTHGNVIELPGKKLEIRVSKNNKLPYELRELVGSKSHNVNHYRDIPSLIKGIKKI